MWYSSCKRGTLASATISRNAPAFGTSRWALCSRARRNFQEVRIKKAVASSSAADRLLSGTFLLGFVSTRMNKWSWPLGLYCTVDC
jgi:hypothetical protein